MSTFFASLSFFPGHIFWMLTLTIWLGLFHVLLPVYIGKEKAEDSESHPLPTLSKTNQERIQRTKIKKEGGGGEIKRFKKENKKIKNKFKKYKHLKKQLWEKKKKSNRESRNHRVISNLQSRFNYASEDKSPQALYWVFPALQLIRSSLWEASTPAQEAKWVKGVTTDRLVQEQVRACVHAKSLQSCLAHCHPMDCSLPGSSVHGILQASIPE